MRRLIFLLPLLFIATLAHADETIYANFFDTNPFTNPSFGKHVSDNDGAGVIYYDSLATAVKIGQIPTASRPRGIDCTAPFTIQSAETVIIDIYVSTYQGTSISPQGDFHEITYLGDTSKWIFNPNNPGRSYNASGYTIEHGRGVSDNLQNNTYQIVRVTAGVRFLIATAGSSFITEATADFRVLFGIEARRDGNQSIRFRKIGRTTGLVQGDTTIFFIDNTYTQNERRIFGVTHGEVYATGSFMWTDSWIIRRITEAPETPTANFAANPETGNAPLTVQFTDQSTGDSFARLWKFGDGETSAVSNPSHVYSTVGFFTVSLAVTGTAGTDTETKVNFIHAIQPSVADFSASPLSGAVPLSVQFTDSSSGDITSRLWRFGDGDMSTVANPLHVYAAVGSFGVSLNVNGTGGSDTETKANFITTTAAPVVAGCTPVLVRSTAPPWRVYRPF